ncbi:hypothetical protein E2C01_012932 [Portunus trituberculatus]|uniref:Uncharacterized protein n=1 Tax=Portunus trituberculatus TaxID=210409 RepID=A0A5B7DEX3_PORTR|nr:hypothetical protein [Portunus trituberculatus]
MLPLFKDNYHKWTEESRMTINCTKTVVMHLLRGSPTSPAHPGTSSPPSVSVDQAAQGHNGRPADMQPAYYRHS